MDDPSMWKNHRLRETEKVKDDMSPSPGEEMGPSKTLVVRSASRTRAMAVPDMPPRKMFCVNIRWMDPPKYSATPQKAQLSLVRRVGKLRVPRSVTVPL